ncbi:MAG: hypothetical protein IJA83_03695 [Clostridia bacterium]|nr:hypothetical protein [Clostridia bacterium]
MKALEIFEQDIIDREAGNPLPRQQYYAALRDALYRELMQQGFSEWLEEVLLNIRGGQMEKIYVVDYAALMECHSMIVLGRDMRDATEYVPHLHLRGEKAAWDALEKPGAFLMPVKGDMVEKFRQLRAVSRQLVDARDDSVLPQADDAAQREIEQVHTLNKMLDERCKALQQERDELQARVKLLEEGIITEQVRYAIEARRIQEEEAITRSYEAQRNAAREAFREQFAFEQENARLRREEEARQLADMRTAAAGDYAAQRTAMAEDLKQLSALLENRFSQWEQSLQHSECRMLAQSYVSLHDLAENALAALILEARCAGTDARLLAGLADLQTQLHGRVNQLEQAMARLGLVVLRPKTGEAVNTAYHIAAKGGSTVTRCIRPGVMVPGAAEALLKAEVDTE